MSSWLKIEDHPIPATYKAVWLYCPVDKVFIGTKGLYSGEWWNASSRVWAPTHWMPFSTPLPPDSTTEIKARKSR